MNLAVDLHSHSGYAGGVGKIELTDISRTMKLKGISVFGTGDCLYPPRLKELTGLLTEQNQGLYSLQNDKSLFLLQTEIIISTRIQGHKNKIMAHHVVLFPDPKTIVKMQTLFNKWGMKNTIGRPYLVSRNRTELIDQLFTLKNLHRNLEIFPAHIMTPDGVYGGKNNLSSLKEFYGEFLPYIKVIETGLSADPDMLSGIPDLKDLTFISNSDCHSAALNRIGREFTILDVDEISYDQIIKALRCNLVVMTAEFNPREGRYFLTGHHAERPGHKAPVFFFEHDPPDLRCPICGKKMTKGVRSRCFELSESRVKKRKRDFLHLIPLVEVIARALNQKSVRSKKVLQEYYKIIDIFGSEIELWTSDNIGEELEKRVDPNIVSRIVAVKNNKFRFDPPGFDGKYGKLFIGEADGH